MRAKRAISGACFLLCAFILVAGCNDSFDPLQQNNKYYFSIYGTLDAAADTQWVRIGVPRENINETPNPSGITVILENVETGQSAVMQDSLFTSGNLLNYWTTMPLENEQTYRIKVSQEDGKASMVTVTIPEELPTPIVINNGPPNPGLSIIIDGSVEHVADVQTKWYVLLYPETQRIKKIYTFTYRNEIIPIPTYGGAWYVFTTNAEQLGYIENNTNAEFAVLHRQFYVAAGGPEWDENISSVDDLEYFLDGTASNVENGLGYVVGIDSKWVPFKSCVTADSSNVAPCEPEKPFW
jgi:hypothetical protein